MLPMRTDCGFYELYGVAARAGGSFDIHRASADVAKRVGGQHREVNLGKDITLLFVSRTPTEQVWADENERVAVAIVGFPVHSFSSNVEFAKAVARAYEESDLACLPDADGSYLVVIFDKACSSLVILTDFLGFAPVIWSASNDFSVFGSRLWPLAEAGLMEKTPDIAAVSSWLSLHYPLNGRTLFKNAKRLAPGAALRLSQAGIEEHGGMTIPKLTIKDQSELVDVLASTIRDGASDLARLAPDVNVLLSGGFDSRTVVAALVGAGLRPPCYVAADLDSEAATAKVVADRLGLDLVVNSLDLRRDFGSQLGLGPNRSPEGFPVGWSVPAASVVLNRLAAPVALGTVGGLVFRSSQESSEDCAELSNAKNIEKAIIENHFRKGVFGIFPRAIGDNLVDHIVREFRSSCQAVLPYGSRAVGLWNILNRQRLWIYNNNLQCSAQAEGLLPLYMRHLVSIKVHNPHLIYDKSLQEQVINKLAPRLKGIPHESMVRRVDDVGFRPPVNRAVARRLLLDSLKGRGLSLASIVPKLAARSLGLSSAVAVTSWVSRWNWLVGAYRGLDVDLVDTVRRHGV